VRHHYLKGHGAAAELIPMVYTPYLAPGGLMVAFLGNRFQDILMECEPLLKEMGLFVFDSKSYALTRPEISKKSSDPEKREEPFQAGV
jgi:hypothetical protein